MNPREVEGGKAWQDCTVEECLEHIIALADFQLTSLDMVPLEDAVLLIEHHAFAIRRLINYRQDRNREPWAE